MTWTLNFVGLLIEKRSRNVKRYKVRKHKVRAEEIESERGRGRWHRSIVMMRWRCRVWKSQERRRCMWRIYLRLKTDKEEHYLLSSDGVMQHILNEDIPHSWTLLTMICGLQVHATLTRSGDGIKFNGLLIYHNIIVRTISRLRSRMCVGPQY